MNEQLCKLRGCTEDFGGIPVVLVGGDFRHFRPVQERSILFPSMAIPWDDDKSFRIEQHRSARQLLTLIRHGIQDRTDVELLNSRCYREGERIPWESGITMVTPLNRNRWNLNIEAAL